MLCLYNILHKKGYQKMSLALYFLHAVSVNTSPLHSLSYIKFRFNKVTVYWFQLFSLNSSFLFSHYCSLSFSLCGNTSFKFLLSIRLYWHHMATLLFYCQLLSSSCGNSISWSWHQICDTSFFYFTLIVLR